MDAYFLSHYKINYPTSNLRVQEVIQHKHLEYGVRVKDIKLADCFREKRYTQEADLYEHAEIYLQQSLSVSTGLFIYIVTQSPQPAKTGHEETLDLFHL